MRRIIFHEHLFLQINRTTCAGVAKIVVFNRANHCKFCSISGKNSYLQSHSVLNNGAADLSYITTPTIYWPMIEAALGVIGACLPLLRPLFSPSSGSKGFGQVRNLRSVRLGSSSGELESPELKPWNEDASSRGQSASEVSIRKFVPSALEPFGEKRIDLPRRADDRV